jgi:integrase/recombinase XerD
MLTKRMVGVPISPHLFRDCAATTIATDDPEHVLTIAPLLGHTTLKTSEKHYNHARSLDASRRYQAVMLEVHEGARHSRRRL